MLAWLRKIAALILRCEPQARLRASVTRYGEPRRMATGSERVAILRDALALLGLLRMRAEFV
jgi:hypothetical protein